MRDDAPLVRFSDFLGIGYFGNAQKHIIAPIFDLRQSAERAWARVMEAPLFHAVFVEHPAKYEVIAHPVGTKPDRINRVLYRSLSSLDSLRRLKSIYGGRTFVKFGWHDVTKVQKFDVLARYAKVDSAEFRKDSEFTPSTLVDQIRKSWRMLWQGSGISYIVELRKKSYKRGYKDNASRYYYGSPYTQSYQPFFRGCFKGSTTIFVKL